MSKNESRHPKGYWMSVGISTGVGIGVALGVALENIGAGIALGVAIGAGIGASLEQKNKDNIRPLTEQEKKAEKGSGGRFGNPAHPYWIFNNAHAPESQIIECIQKLTGIGEFRNEHNK